MQPLAERIPPSGADSFKQCTICHESLPYQHDTWRKTWEKHYHEHVSRALMPNQCACFKAFKTTDALHEHIREASETDHTPREHIQGNSFEHKILREQISSGNFRVFEEGREQAIVTNMAGVAKAWGFNRDDLRYFNTHDHKAHRWLPYPGTPHIETCHPYGRFRIPREFIFGPAKTKRKFDSDSQSQISTDKTNDHFDSYLKEQAGRSSRGPSTNYMKGSKENVEEQAAPSSRASLGNHMAGSKVYVPVSKLSQPESPQEFYCQICKKPGNHSFGAIPNVTWAAHYHKHLEQALMPSQCICSLGFKSNAELLNHINNQSPTQQAKHKVLKESRGSDRYRIKEDGNPYYVKFEGIAASWGLSLGDAKKIRAKQRFDFCNHVVPLPELCGPYGHLSRRLRDQKLPIPEDTAAKLEKAYADRAKLKSRSRKT